jgi:Protein of unknown function (DUF1566)
MKGTEMNRLKLILIMLTSLIIFLPSLSFPGEVNLPKTGQQTCYDENGNVIDCTNTGQDVNVQTGVEWPSPRFEDNGDGTVTDHLTELIWLKDAKCGGSKNWSDALTFCNNLESGSCGLSDGSVAGDWRLPNVLELESLVNSEASNQGAWLNTQGFNNVQLSYYWSATTHAYFPYLAWKVRMYYGGSVYGSYKSGKSYVWPVRSGQ